MCSRVCLLCCWNASWKEVGEIRLYNIKKEDDEEGTKEPRKSARTNLFACVCVIRMNYCIHPVCEDEMLEGS